MHEYKGNVVSRTLEFRKIYKNRIVGPTFRNVDKNDNMQLRENSSYYF